MLVAVHKDSIILVRVNAVSEHLQCSKVAFPSVRDDCQLRLRILLLCFPDMYIHRSLALRVSECRRAPSSGELPLLHFAEVGAFAPLAGARLMLTCRAGFPVLLRFLRTLRDLGSHSSSGCNPYERRLQEIRRTLPRGVIRDPQTYYRHSFADAIATVAEGGADSDLLFALLQIQMGAGFADLLDYSAELADAFLVCDCSIDYPEPDYEAESPTWEPEEEYKYVVSPLYSACGPRGDDTAVSLLIKIGLNVNELERYAVTRNGCHTRRTALYWALANNRLSAVKMLLRSKASVGSRGGEIGRTPEGRAYVRTPIHLALRIAKRTGVEAPLRILLEHGFCPFCTISSCADLEYFFQRDVLTRSGVLGRVLSTCESRCHCKACESELSGSLSWRKRKRSP